MGMEPCNNRRKLIIDTDPGIDDAMAIFLAFNSPEVEILGLTTIFGNVPTTMATRNALHLLEFIGREDIPVASGSLTSIKKVLKQRIADFVHGTDGLGNTHPLPSKGKAIDMTATDFLLQQAKKYPGEVTVVALGPLTNVAMAIEADPAFATEIGQIVVLGGAFFVNGNVNPASEANVFGDPEAADIVFTSGANVVCIGLNVTHQVVLSDRDFAKLSESDNKYAKYIYKAAQFYFQYHDEVYGIKGVYIHDPTALVAAIDPSLFTYLEGVVRVQLDGISRGLTLISNTHKRWGEVSEWCGRPAIKVAVTVDGDRISKMLMDRLLSC